MRESTEIGSWLIDALLFGAEEEEDTQVDAGHQGDGDQGGQEARGRVGCCLCRCSGLGLIDQRPLVSIDAYSDNIPWEPGPLGSSPR